MLVQVFSVKDQGLKGAKAPKMFASERSGLRNVDVYYILILKK